MDTLATWFVENDAALQALAQKHKLTTAQLQQRLRQALQDTAPAQEEPEGLRLLHTLMHELRTPLVTLRGYVDMMARGRLGPTTPLQEQSMRTAQRNAAALEDQIETALHFARLQRGQCHIQKRDISLARLLERSLRFFDTQAERKQLSLHLEQPQQDITLHTDPSHIERVLRILLDNAIKFTSQGQVTLYAQLQGDALHLGVRDTGRGFTPEQTQTLFAPFAQLHHDDKGAGLGLTVAHGLLQGHRCTLHAESQPDQGSHFWFALPL